VSALVGAWGRVAPTVARWMPWLRLVGFVAAIGIVVVMGVVAARDVPFDELDWALLIPALAAAILWWLALAGGWSLLAAGRLERGEVSMWCRTQSLRYLPGGFWGPASRVLATGGSALDRLSTVAAENVVSLCCALAVSGAALTIADAPWWLGLVALSVVPWIAARPLATRTRLAPSRVRHTTLACLAGFVLYVVAAVLVQGAVSGMHEPVRVAGAAALAWSAGLVVVIAPGGIGARELVYVALLSGHLDHADLAAGAVTLRVLTIVAELGVLVTLGRPPRTEETANRRANPEY
jgi:glycosyltransferase 2 family protein